MPVTKQKKVKPTGEPGVPPSNPSWMDRVRDTTPPDPEVMRQLELLNMEPDPPGTPWQNRY